MSPGKNPKNPKTTPNDLHRQLDYLKLPFMREHLEELTRQAAEGQWSHQEFLARLVQG